METVNSENWKEDIIKNKLGGKREWTDKERMELSYHLDRELEEKLKDAKKNVKEDQWSESNWKEQMAEHPIFAPYLQEGNDLIAPVNELSEGLAQLKYDPEHSSLQEVAQNYKEEGILYYKLKKYSTAVRSFTEGIKQKCNDEVLNAQLYNNRAAAHFYLGNHRSCINDCQAALERNSNYTKAITRAIDSCFKLGSYEEACHWCDKGLLLDPTDQSISEKRCKAVNFQKEKSRNERRKLKQQQKKIEKEKRLLEIINSRGVTIGIRNSADIVSPESLSLKHLEPSDPAVERVHLDENGDLVWPVMFLYPEYAESDLIMEAQESSTLLDHLNAMFGDECERASWDREGSYSVGDLMAFFEDVTTKVTGLVKVNLKHSFKSIFADKRYRIRAGTPSFIILNTKSLFSKSFIDGYER